MTITLNLTPDMELYLIQKAEQKGISVEDYTLEILTEYISNDDESKESILNSLRTSFQEAKAGKTKPVSQLWDWNVTVESIYNR
ncbi:hypothetical protein [Calothrix sp. CCY 0018]|uniref:hypothetical protein n=1 Tax=Calothrix sp. CCY 0018 TaxID=3103864 RepID=UPI0039C6D70E